MSYQFQWFCQYPALPIAFEGPVVPARPGAAASEAPVVVAFAVGDVVVWDGERVDDWIVPCGASEPLAFPC